MKKVQVIWTTESIRDLEIIYDFLAVSSSPAAQKICQNVLSRAQQIEAFPESGSPLIELKSTSYIYRYLVEGNYKIVGAAYIHTIFDSRLNPEKLKV